VRLTRREGERAIFGAGPDLPTGTFGVANYERAMYLLPIDGAADAADREGFWRRIAGYAEHLSPANQEPGANIVSEWLVRDVLLRLGRSFYELGCGAGRNLVWLRQVNPDVEIYGVDVNSSAISQAHHLLPDASLSVGSVYEVADAMQGQVDVAFTSGVLMHVPPSHLDGVLRAMHLIARVAVVHFELHGPSHHFDYHRYPRDYSQVYKQLEIQAEYTVFDRDDFRSRGTDSFQHALLVARHDTDLAHSSGL
jgi:SAM-dependent methyltransferase